MKPDIHFVNDQVKVYCKLCVQWWRIEGKVDGVSIRTAKRFCRDHAAKQHPPVKVRNVRA